MEQKIVNWDLRAVDALSEVEKEDKIRTAAMQIPMLVYYAVQHTLLTEQQNAPSLFMMIRSCIDVLPASTITLILNDIERYSIYYGEKIHHYDEWQQLAKELDIVKKKLLFGDDGAV